jgi:hypothetical protein
MFFKTENDKSKIDVCNIKNEQESCESQRKRDKGGIVLLALMCRVGGPLLPGGGRGGEGVIQELKSSLNPLF